MSDSARHNLSLVVESAYGTTPATPNFQRLRHTGTTLGLSKSTFISEELRADRQIADFRHGTKQIGGDIATEFSYLTLDALLEATLMGTWTIRNAPYAAGTISAAASDNSINDSANGFPLFQVGDKITISGFTGAGTTANQSVKVISSTVSKIVVQSAIPFVNDAAAETVTITSLTYSLKAGIVRRSFSALREFTDLATGQFHLFTGVEMAKLQLAVAVNAIVKATFSVVGKSMASPANVAPSGTTYTAQNTNTGMDSFGGAVIEGGSAIATITEIQATLENGNSPRFVVGQDTTILPSIGRSNLSGTISAYFEDSTLLNKFINATESTLQFSLTDALGNAYVFTFPRIKYNGGQPDTQGQGPITLSLPFQALYDATTGTQVTITRHPTTP